VTSSAPMMSDQIAKYMDHSSVQKVDPVRGTTRCVR
jgi:hypothetical protein